MWHNKHIVEFWKNYKILPSAKNRDFTNYYTNTLARRTVNNVMKKTFNFWWLESRNLLCPNEGKHYFESFFLFLCETSTNLCPDGRYPEVLRSGMVQYITTHSPPHSARQCSSSTTVGAHISFYPFSWGHCSIPSIIFLAITADEMYTKNTKIYLENQFSLKRARVQNCFYLHGMSH